MKKQITPPNKVIRQSTDSVTPFGTESVILRTGKTACRQAGAQDKLQRNKVYGISPACHPLKFSMMAGRYRAFLYFLMPLYLIPYTSPAQNIGINTTGATPDNSAMLDIVNTSKGLLIPRVALASSTTTVTIASPATSLLVYNDGTGGLTPAGYYYNSGTPGSPLWVQLLNGGNPGTAWMLKGNTGITNPAAPATYGTSAIGATENWMGTTDARDIVFGTNNIERMRIKQTTGRVGIGTAAPNAKLDVEGTTKLGSGGVVFTALKSESFSLDFPSTANAECSYITLTLSEDGVIVGVKTPNTPTANTSVVVYHSGITGCTYNNQWRVSTGNTNIDIGFENASGSAQDPPPMTVTVYYILP